MGECAEGCGAYDGVAMGGGRLMTTREVAERLGVGERRVLKLVRSRRLPSLSFDGARRRGRRYDPATVEAFAARSRPGGGPRGSLSRMTTGRRSRWLNAVRRELTPRSREVFDAAMAAAVRRAAAEAESSHERHRGRLAAAAAVIRATARAWAAPAKTGVEQHRNLVLALRPWLKLG